MPFTFSHPAIVLPFGINKTKYLDFSALVIGSMSPDFEYFLHFKLIQIIGHTIIGQFLFCLPMTFIILYIYHNIIKKPLINNLPSFVSCRYYYLVENEWKINSIFRFVVVIYSVLIGSFSHLFWDSFTHKNGYFVSRINFLSNSISVFNFKIHIYKLLQHGSTLIGMGFILLYLYLIQDKKTELVINAKDNNKMIYWIGVFFIGILILSITLLNYGYINIGILIVASINGIFIGIVIMSIISKRRNKE